MKKGPAPFKPRNCEIILNYDCNARCKFCYHPDAEAKAPERMSFEAAAKALYKGRREGCWIAYLIGGEITLRDDLPKIIKTARGLGYPYIQVMSNALKLADRAYTKSLVDAGANLFRISIHGHNAKLHDGQVCVPGAFAKVLRAVENIRALGAEATVNVALNRHNYRHMDKWLDLVSGRLGVTDFNIIFPHYKGMMAEHAAELKVELTEALPHMRRALRGLAASGREVEGPLLINFCPCNLPEAVHLMGEWERPADPVSDEPLYYIEGAVDRVYEMKERFRVKNKGCARCIYNSRCMGFEKWYYDLFGGREFRPVLKEAAPLPLLPSHRRLKEAEALVARKSGK